MKVLLDLANRRCEVVKEDADPKFSGVVGGVGESKLLHHVKLELIKQGFDVIKKRMWRDGHLVDDLQQYIRTRSTKAGFMVYNSCFAVEGAEEIFNREGKVRLTVECY